MKIKMNLDLVKGITKSTSEIKKDYVYCCFVGVKFDGHNFIEEAFNMGAIYVIGSKDYDHDNYYKINDVNAVMAHISQQIYNYKDNDLNVIGVTGTDGKTSTSLIINYILNRIETCSYIGTSGTIINNDEEGYDGITTPFPDTLYKKIDHINSKSDNLVMEISSHALQQKRIWGLELDYAIFTNLSQDHLDFHDTMENYFHEKKKIVKYLKKDGKLVLNIDDEYSVKFNYHSVITFGKNEYADYQIKNIQKTLAVTSFELEYQNKTYLVATKLLAEFNVYNLTAAIATLHDMGHDLEAVIALIGDYIVPGRLEVVKTKDTPSIILDFAHTPKSINKVMKFVDEYKKGKVIVVGGTAGGRDKSKRPLMGNEMAKYADYLILSEDDPRDEDVHKINEELKAGIENSQCQVIEIINREEAVEYAIKKSDNNDIIVLLGKAGQTKMYYDGTSRDYDERKIVQGFILKETNER